MLPSTIILSLLSSAVYAHSNNANDVCVKKIPLTSTCEEWKFYCEEVNVHDGPFNCGQGSFNELIYKSSRGVSSYSALGMYCDERREVWSLTTRDGAWARDIEKAGNVYCQHTSCARISQICPLCEWPGKDDHNKLSCPPNHTMEIRYAKKTRAMPYGATFTCKSFGWEDEEGYALEMHEPVINCIPIETTVTKTTTTYDCDEISTFCPLCEIDRNSPNKYQCPPNHRVEILDTFQSIFSNLQFVLLECKHGVWNWEGTNWQSVDWSGRLLSDYAEVKCIPIETTVTSTSKTSTTEAMTPAITADNTRNDVCMQNFPLRSICSPYNHLCKPVQLRDGNITCNHELDHLEFVADDQADPDDVGITFGHFMYCERNEGVWRIEYKHEGRMRKARQGNVYCQYRNCADITEFCPLCTWELKSWNNHNKYSCPPNHTTEVRDGTSTRTLPDAATFLCKYGNWNDDEGNVLSYSERIHCVPIEKECVSISTICPSCEHGRTEEGGSIHRCPHGHSVEIRCDNYTWSLTDSPTYECKQGKWEGAGMILSDSAVMSCVPMGTASFPNSSAALAFISYVVLCIVLML